MINVRKVAFTMLLVLLVVLTVDALARGPRYRYGETWWEEYAADEGTSLLLHFGPPQPRRARILARKVEAERKRQDVRGTLEEIEQENDMVTALKPKDLGKPKPVDPESVPEGTVLDYSHRRLKFRLGKGVAIAENGRFGSALECKGTGGQVTPPVAYNTGQSMECWFRISEYPRQSACILSVNEDEGRILLHPDGRLELKLKHPHGHPSKRHLSAEEIEVILERDATIISPEPVPLNEWTHVMAFTHWPVVQGAGSPFDATLKVNGFDVANYLSEVNNGYNFMGRRSGVFTIGNNADMKEPFKGLIDEVRVCHEVKRFYTKPPMPWRDLKAERELQFGKPWFLADGTVFHASLDNGLQFDINRSGADGIELDLQGQRLTGLLVPAIRGKGWVVDKMIGCPRFPLKGMNAVDGSLEFWVRPVNWDDVTGYWVHSPPDHRLLSIARFYGVDRRDGKEKLFMRATLPRAHNNERGRVPIDPGHWNHITVVWSKGDLQRAFTYLNGRWFARIHRASPDLLQNIEPTHVEFGVSDDVTVKNMERPLIEIDEVVGYDYRLSNDEIRQAYHRWQGTLKPIELYDCRTSYKFSIAELTFDLTTKLPHDVEPAKLHLSLVGADGNIVRGPFEKKIEDKKVHVLLSSGDPLPYGDYRFKFRVTDTDGNTAIDAEKAWQFKKEPWRGNQIGILSETPPPWTPVEISETEVRTRMTRYELGRDGLPTAIYADGKNLLAAPVRLLEDGRPMPGGDLNVEESRNVEASWGSLFQGRSCDISMRCTAEYDGMVRYELRLKPRGRLGRIAFVIPMRADMATRYMYNLAGRTGVGTNVVPREDGTFLSSRRPDYWRAEWRAKRHRKADPVPPFEEYKAWAFFTQMDVNNMNRGLYWFADNARGWWQSKSADAQELTRKGDTVYLTCNLIAEPVELTDPQPIVFGIIPHPARPLPEKYRLYERVSAEADPKACSIFDAFNPWPMNPRTHMMKLFPAPDPKKLDDDSPSWEYAERCRPHMRAAKPEGYITMYLSKYWFSCRAGAYDGWEWRGGPTGQATLSDSFVDYLCWEMNEWIGRGIFDAIYLDECYEAPSDNVRAGQAVRLPDGSVQKGATLWGYRELMKRWRNIFHQHNMTPMLLGHHTRSYMYCGNVFSDAMLDGEGHPTITANSRDFVDALALHRAEVIQNGRMWGVTPFFMVSIWEGGLSRGKGYNPHKRWSWRMACGAMSVLAHFENGTAYTDQGSSVYRNYWNDVLRWGAGDPAIPFRSYWNNDEYLTVEGQGAETLVSFYHKPDRILLIASNRTRKEREIRIKLNREALGLRRPLRLEVWDSGYKPVEGLDIQREKDRKEVAAKLNEFNLDGVERDADFLEALNTQKKKAESRPRIEGDTLILPTRPHDFRMVSVEGAK